MPTTVIVLLAIAALVSSLTDALPQGYTYSQDPFSQDKQIQVTLTTNATKEFCICRKDRYTNYLVILGIAKGTNTTALSILNTHMNYPIYTSETNDITTTYNKKWSPPTEFCRCATVYIDGGVVTNETTIEIRLHQYQNATSEKVDEVEVVIIEKVPVVTDTVGGFAGCNGVKALRSMPGLLITIIAVATALFSVMVH